MKTIQALTQNLDVAEALYLCYVALIVVISLILLVIYFCAIYKFLVCIISWIFGIEPRFEFVCVGPGELLVHFVATVLAFLLCALIALVEAWMVIGDDPAGIAMVSIIVIVAAIITTIVILEKRVTENAKSHEDEDKDEDVTHEDEAQE